MTYKDWNDNHLDKLTKVVESKKDFTLSETIDYFDYENMAINESEFCPLYREFTKCHQVNKLNCLLCSCPYFKYSDDEPFHITEDGNKVMSICTISSTKAKTFTFNNISHCDCSDCHIPHSKKHIDKFMTNNEIVDSVSLLERIRQYQLTGIFGKYKLF